MQYFTITQDGAVTEVDDESLPLTDVDWIDAAFSDSDVMTVQVSLADGTHVRIERGME